jgi:hypothetical protein
MRLLQAIGDDTPEGVSDETERRALVAEHRELEAEYSGSMRIK